MKQHTLTIYIITALLMNQLFIAYLAIPLMQGNRLTSEPIEIEKRGALVIIPDKAGWQVRKKAATKPKVVVESDESIARREALKVDKEKGLLILVNKQNALDSSYKPEDLADIKYYAPDRSSAGRFMRAEAADAFHQLSEAAAEEGHEIIVTTAYRSYNFQSILYNNYVKNYGQEEADTFSAKPGTSEHQTGLAADVSSPSVNYQLTKDYINTPEGKWLSENAYKFGFIIRFLKGKEDITGYMYEPWHIRYVGKTAAKEIYDKGITLEEFLEKEI